MTTWTSYDTSKPQLPKKAVSMQKGYGYTTFGDSTSTRPTATPAPIRAVCSEKGHYGFRREPWLSAATRQRIADYDNATLHNDRTIKAILTAHKNRPIIAIYFSDHGEEVYDFRNAYGRIGAHDSMSDRTAIKIYRRPLWRTVRIWCSDAYIARHPGALESIKRHIMRPATTDLVGHTLLNLSGISSPAYRPDLDMLNPAYRPRHGMTPSRLGQAE